MSTVARSALLLAAILLISQPVLSDEILVIDDWWSVDYARNACSNAQQWAKDNHDAMLTLSCDQLAGCSDMMPVFAACATDSKIQVRNFENLLVTQMTATQMCQGLSISIYRGPNEPSPADALSSKPHWSLQLNFSPGKEKQWWQMTHDNGPNHTNYSEATDDVGSLASKVCTIIKGQGAKLLE